jgi:hypothetical protein
MWDMTLTHVTTRNKVVCEYTIRRLCFTVKIPSTPECPNGHVPSDFPTKIYHLSRVQYGQRNFFDLITLIFDEECKL